jgi:hypothetical protein
VQFEGELIGIDIVAQLAQPLGQMCLVTHSSPRALHEGEQSVAQGSRATVELDRGGTEEATALEGVLEVIDPRIHQRAQARQTIIEQPEQFNRLLLEWLSADGTDAKTAT